MLVLLIQVTLLFLAGLAAVLATKRSTAAMRHLICACALAGSLLLPFTALLPSRAVPMRLQAIDATTVTHAAARLANWPGSSILLALWISGSALLLLRVAIGYLRIHRLIRTSTPIEASL